MDQWTQPTPGSGPIYYNLGNVGIGTTTPGRLLHLSAFGQPSLAFSDVSGTAGNKSSGFIYDGGSNIGGIGGLVFQDFTDTGSFAANRFTLWKDGSINFGGIGRPASVGQVVFTGGNVGIGTTNPQYPLSVHGTIQSTEVIVNTNWSDYVFNPHYRLRSLSNVAAYIKDNHHLPGIPSEAEVKEKGISLGEMQAKLLAKIEELTLHMIQSDERNTRLEQANRELRQRMARVEGQR